MDYSYIYDDWSPILYAISISNVDKVKELISSKIDLNYVNKSTILPSCTPLQIAIKVSNEEIIKLLLPLSDVNEQDSFGFTALHYAVLIRNKNIVNLLLASNASVLIATESGTTPLDMAQHLKYNEIVDILESQARLEDDPHKSEFIEWLTYLGCKEYYYNFIKSGYDLSFISKHGLNDEDLDCIGIPPNKLGIRRKLIRLYKLDSYYNEDSGEDSENLSLVDEESEEEEESVDEEDSYTD